MDDLFDEMKKNLDPEIMELMADILRDKDVRIPLSKTMKAYRDQHQKELDLLREKGLLLVEEIEKVNKQMEKNKKVFWFTAAKYLNVSEMTPLEISEDDTEFLYSQKVADRLRNEPLLSEVKREKELLAKELAEAAVLALGDPINKEEQTEKEDEAIIDFQQMLNRKTVDF